MTDWQKRMKLVNEMAGISDGHSHRVRDIFSTDVLSKGLPIEVDSKLLGHRSIKTTDKHYAPWVAVRQRSLERDVGLE